MRLKFDYRLPALRPDFTPLVDIVFLLLIFFALTSSFVNYTGLRVNIPRAVTAKFLKEGVVTVSVAKDGEVFLNGGRVSFQELKEELAKIRDLKRVSLEADEAASLKMLVRIWDLCREQGIGEVNILTRR